MIFFFVIFGLKSPSAHLSIVSYFNKVIILYISIDIDFYLGFFRDFIVVLLRRVVVSSRYDVLFFIVLLRHLFVCGRLR